MHTFQVRAVRLLLMLSLAVTGQLAAKAALALVGGVQGTLSNQGGGSIADGTYGLTFTLLDGPAGKVLWSEGPVLLPVSGGFFQHSLGSKVPLTPAVLAGDRWISVQVGLDPALAAVPLRAALTSFRAQVAEGLECSGCLTAAHLDPAALQPYAKTADLSAYTKAADLAAYAKLADLGVYAKSADLAAYAKGTDLADYVKAAALAKVAGTGSYKDLKDLPKLADVAASGTYGDLGGLPVLAKVGAACGTGLVMHGIKADGSYDCVAGGVTAANLPSDGLNEVSNNLLTNQFTELAISTKTPIDIPDNLGAGISDAIDVPDYGLAQGLSIAVDISNSDISKLRVTVFDPTGAPHKLYDQTGTGKTLKGSWPPNTLASGDLGVWTGKNPKGNWSINVADLAGVANGKDGKINSWSVGVQTLSSKKVAATAGFQLGLSDIAPVPCQPTHFGMMYASAADKAFYVCNGKDYVAFSLVPVGTQDNPGSSCKEILTKQPSAKDGWYWLKTALAPVQAYCDMTTQGGGWTQVVRCAVGDNCVVGGKFLYVQDWTAADMGDPNNGSYISGKSLGTVVGSGSEMLVSVTNTANKSMGHMHYPMSGGALLAYFASAGFYESPMITWTRVDTDGSKATYTSRLCYAPTYTYKVRTLQGGANFTFFGNTSATPSGSAGGSCDYGPWSAQMLIRDYSNSLTAMFGIAPVTDWKSQPYEHRILVR